MTTPDYHNTTSGCTIALLLPGYSPDLAWMHRALNADLVILDDRHSFSRKGRVHRARIRTPQGQQWLSIPFISDDHRKPINQVRIDDRRPWLKHHIRALEYNYRNSLYFDYYEPEIRADLENAASCEYMIDAISILMERQWTYLQLPELPVFISELTTPDATLPQSNNYSQDYVQTLHQILSKTDELRLVSKIPTSENLTIWQEPESRNYQKPYPEADHPSFTHPKYRQHFPGFVPGCGVLDFLFQYGPDSWKILDQLKPHSK